MALEALMLNIDGDTDGSDAGDLLPVRVQHKKVGSYVCMCLYCEVPERWQLAQVCFSWVAFHFAVLISTKMIPPSSNTGENGERSMLPVLVIT